MPIIDMPVEALLGLINRPGAQPAGEKLTVARLGEMLPKIGCAVESLTEAHQYACRRCDKIFDRTEAQGKPLHCTQCGTDFRAAPDELADMGRSEIIRLELLAVRPDIFDPGGMARLVRGYLGWQSGLTQYPLAPPKLRVKVDPKLARDESYRPFIACAVLRNVRFNHSLIKMLMNLQEDLHWALGRNRKLASIGVYDLKTLSGTTFLYDAIAPDGVRFVPLGFKAADASAKLTPREILERHKTGQTFAHLLASFSAYPLLRDEAGTVLSMPPIINSEATRVTLKSTDLFADVTGLSQRSVDRALNVLVTSLKEIQPDIEIEAVTIEREGVTRITPDLKAAEMTIDVPEVSATIGASLDANATKNLLERMGHGVKTGGANKLVVSVPAYRNDVMHPVDLIEDAAIAFGYDHLQPELIPTFTVGAPRELEERSAVARRVLTGLGFHQVMTLVLTSVPAAFEKWRTSADPRAVEIENPISTEQTHCRVSILPGLLETLAINKQYDLPQQIFEVGDCAFFDGACETGAREERFVAAAMIGTHTGYADIRAVADAFGHEMLAALKIEALEHPSFIPGRAALLKNSDEQQIGMMGEVHPEIIERYGLKHAVAVMELSLERM